MNARGNGFERIVCRWAGIIMLLAGLLTAATGSVAGGSDAGWACVVVMLLPVGIALMGYGFSSGPGGRNPPYSYHEPFQPTAVWQLPPQMLTGRAKAVWERRAAAEPSPEARREALRSAYEAAQLLIAHAGVWAEDEASLVRRCVADRAYTRRLYHVAARRLHPDRNGGRHDPEWERLQSAVARLRDYQQI
jgi:hypothetical protein